MKPLICAGVLLAAVITASVLSNLHTRDMAAAIELELSSCLAYAESGRWDEAAGAASDARERMEGVVTAMSFYMRHDLLTDACALLARLEAAVAANDVDAVRIEASDAARLLRRIRDIDRPNPENIF